MAALLALLAVAVQATKPSAESRAAAESRPEVTELRVGTAASLELPRAPASRAIRIVVAPGETISLTVDSFQGDVVARIEDASGAVVAEDDDAGIATNALITWTAGSSGPYVVRVCFKDGEALPAWVGVLRGAVDPRPPDPEAAEIAYWQRAWDRAQKRKNATREAAALERIAELAGGSDREAAKKAWLDRAAVVASVRSGVEEVNAARAARGADAARAKLRQVVAELHPAPNEEDDALGAEVEWQIGTLARELGERRIAVEAWKRVVALYERTLLPHNVDIAGARSLLAMAHRSAGDFSEALVVSKRALEAVDRTLADSQKTLRSVLQNHAMLLLDMGDLAGARAAMERVVRACEATLPDDAQELQEARQKLSLVVRLTGDLKGALAIDEQLVATYSSRLDADDPSLTLAKQQLAGSLFTLGEEDRARVLYEEVLATRLRTSSDDHEDVARARMNLALVRMRAGRLEEARELDERALAALALQLPEDHPLVTTATNAYGVALYRLGDFPAARVLLEKAVRARERTLPAGHPDLLDAQQNLGVVLYQLRDFAAARAIFEALLQARERELAADHPALLDLRQNLAATLHAMREFDQAKKLERRVVASCEAVLAPEHIELLVARHNLANTLRVLGELDEVRELESKTLAVIEKTFPESNPIVRVVRESRVATLAQLRDAPALAAAIAALARCAMAQLATARSLSPRQAAEVASSMRASFSAALSARARAASSPELDAILLRWIETCRFASTLEDQWTGGVDRDDPEIAALRAAAFVARRKAAAVVFRAGAEGAASNPSGSAVADAALERDRVERKVREVQAAKGAAPVEVRPEALAHALPKGSAFVSFLEYDRVPADAASWADAPTEESMLAHVVLPSGEIRRIELGPVAPIASAVERWRAALGAPVDPRGIGGVAAVASTESANAAGSWLREHVLDPVCETAGGPRTLFVCLDGPLHLVPLDALPRGEGVVGDAMTVSVEVSLARWLAPRKASPLPPSLLALGGIDFDAEEVSPPRADAPARGESGAAATSVFEPLPATAREVDAVVESFRARFSSGAVVLTGRAASKKAFIEAAPKARSLHLATHGYFNAERTRSRPDVSRAPNPFEAAASLEDTVRGFSPMSLCGVALAGANQSARDRGERTGILTAEEIAGFDLRSCDLAVFSACESSVGLLRAGQGIASLQAALHGAGVRTAVTSLWKVPDDLTRQLMADFYRRLWIEKTPAGQALWDAKRALRNKGAPASAWAGWMLTGDPGGETVRPSSGPSPR